MKRGQFGAWYWYREGRHMAFVIDFTDWGVRARFGASWEFHLLCFKLMGI